MKKPSDPRLFLYIGRGGNDEADRIDCLIIDNWDRHHCLPFYRKLSESKKCHPDNGEVSKRS